MTLTFSAQVTHLPRTLSALRAQPALGSRLVRANSLPSQEQTEDMELSGELGVQNANLRSRFETLTHSALLGDTRPSQDGPGPVHAAPPTLGQPRQPCFPGTETQRSSQTSSSW